MARPDHAWLLPSSLQFIYDIPNTSLVNTFQSFIALFKDELYEHFIRDHHHFDASMFLSLVFFYNLHSGRKSLNLRPSHVML